MVQDMKSADIEVTVALSLYRAEHAYIQEAIDRLRGKGATATLGEVRAITAKYLKDKTLTEDFLAMRHED